MRMQFDHYTVTARLLPALLVIAPLGVLLFVWIPGESLVAGGLLGIIGTGGGAALLAQMGRDRGKKKEADLWRRWGGTPTTCLLRFRDSSNRILLDQWRTKLETAIGHRLPSEEEEAADPLGADQHYEAAINFLLEATRDRSTFPLVFAENVNYGFRRKPLGTEALGPSGFPQRSGRCLELLPLFRGYPARRLLVGSSRQEPRRSRDNTAGWRGSQHGSDRDLASDRHARMGENCR